MHCPELYVKCNALQRRDANDISSKYVGNMIWKPDEVVLDVGCGPGDVTCEIIYPLIKDKIKQLIGADISKEMIEYAIRTYERSNVNFEVVDIENTNDCGLYTRSFDKIFSFFCFQLVYNKLVALRNMHLMLKRGGEMLFTFFLIIPIVGVYKSMDTEWQKYIDDMKIMLHTTYSKDEVKTLFIDAGFRIISIESNCKKYTFPDITSLLNALKPADEIFNVLPPHLHDKYSAHFNNTVRKEQWVDICPVTGKTTVTYYPIIVHAIKD